jgi:hypothetical protein
LPHTEFYSNIAALKKRLKQALHIKSGNVVDASEAVLLLVAGRTHCSFALMSSVSKELVEFGCFTGGDEEEDYSAFFEEQEALRKNYHQSVIGYDIPGSVFIPAAYYNEADAGLHLEMLYGADEHPEVISDILTGYNLCNVYRLPENLKAAARKFTHGRQLHLYSVLLKNFSVSAKEVVLADFKTDEFTVVVSGKSKLMLAQTWSYSSPEDVLYYLLKICRQFGLSQQETTVVLSGLIEKDSAVYRELYKYFVCLEFDILHGHVKLADALAEYPAHYFSTLSKLGACVS